MSARGERRVGDYVLSRQLGEGGMASVFLARHLRTGAEYAVKLLETRDPDLQARFRREAEAQATLRHPSLITVHGFGEEAGRLWLAMDLAPGGDLQGRLETQGPLGCHEAVRLVTAVGEGLAHAHAAGILHRDVKPANVLFDEHGQPRLTDFGLAHIAAQQRLTQTGQLLGTPSYMAPEQVNGAAVDARTDVYGLGALLYHALTGQPPFHGAAVINTVHQVIHDPPTPPSRVRPGIPRPIERACLRALAKDPEQRFPDVGAFLTALTTSRRVTRGQWVAAAAAALPLGIALGVGLSAGSSPGGAAASTSPTAPTPTATPTPAPSSALPEPVSLADLKRRVQGAATTQAAMAVLDGVDLEQLPEREREAWDRELFAQVTPMLGAIGTGQRLKKRPLLLLVRRLGTLARVSPRRTTLLRGAWAGIRDQYVKIFHQKLDPELLVALGAAYADDLAVVDHLLASYVGLGEIQERREPTARAFAALARRSLPRITDPELRRKRLRQLCMFQLEAGDLGALDRTIDGAMQESGWSGRERAGLLVVRARGVWRQVRREPAKKTAALLGRMRSAAQTAKQLDPSLAIAEFYLAEAERERGERPAALVAYERFCAAAVPAESQHEARAVYTIAVSWLWTLAKEAGQLSRAKAGIEKIAVSSFYDDREPSRSGWRVRLAKLCLDAGDRRRAVEHLMRANELARNPRDRLHRLQEAVSQAHTGLVAGGRAGDEAFAALLKLLDERWPEGGRHPR